MVLPSVLVLLALSSLLILPSLDYVSTNLSTTERFEKELKGLYAADVGVEDALWRLANDMPASFPYSYELADINGMTVDVAIDEVTDVAGEEMGSPGDHGDWMIIDKVVTYDSGIYSYTMSITNNGSGNIKIEKILIDFPPELEYVDESTGGNITTDDPTVSGLPSSGITLIWEMSSPLPTIPVDVTYGHSFQLSGPPDVSGVEGHGIIQVNRDDIGTVWDSDSHPFSIIAQAKDSSDNLVAAIRAGIWVGSQLKISCWQVNP